MYPSTKGDFHGWKLMHISEGIEGVLVMCLNVFGEGFRWVVVIYKLFGAI